MKGYSFTAPPGRAAPRVSITDTARKLVFCQLSGQIRVAGVAELGEGDVRMRPERLAALIATARESLPEAAEFAAAGAGWSGLRPMTPSSIPIIARPRDRLIVNVGHGALGWTLAMGAAERAAALVTGERAN
jgi:D-amino-acid dehydrogenase